MTIISTWFCLVLAAFAWQQACAQTSRSWRMDVSSKAEAKAKANEYWLALKDRKKGSSLKGALNMPVASTWWTDFKSSNSKTFKSEREEEDASNNFLDNLEFIEKINKDDNKRYWLGPNQFSDRSYDTLKASLLMRVNTSHIRSARVGKTAPSSGRGTATNRKLLQVARSVNWRTAGKTTPVRDQGSSCGSCWAFAATTALESVYMITAQPGDPKTTPLSQQHLIDCETPTEGFYSQGCNGGYSDGAFEYVFRRNQVTSKKYVYSGRQGACQRLTVDSPALGTFIKLGGVAPTLYPLQNDPIDLMAAVSQSPVVVYLEASPAFIAYAGGIFDPTNADCSVNVNHAVVIVGFNYTGNFATSHWLVQNSWGTSWGEQGYIRMAMQPPGAGPCGMYQYPMRPSPTFQKMLAAATQEDDDDDDDDHDDDDDDDDDAAAAAADDDDDDK